MLIFENPALAMFCFGTGVFLSNPGREHEGGAHDLWSCSMFLKDIDLKPFFMSFIFDRIIHFKRRSQAWP